ncbi:MAG TPA: oxygen-independent coproporphyrinogen III oxidase, partial [Kofleriaceae bacterium]|nr:oxygen-independent coproporphyrinogen III oxidase [Kofleriaceae bacterium]
MTCTGLTAETLAELATRGPRYTSYPPATELGPISTELVERELAAVHADGPASLYIHIPFCRSLCWYCGCNVIPTRDASRGDRYLEVLGTEMALLASKLGPRFPVNEIALGGGSPNFLSPGALRNLMVLLDRNFAVAPDARMSIELDPRTTSSLQVVTLGMLGFRAMSLGVQDFAQPVQDAIHRHQSRAQTAWLIQQGREHGFTDINLDIVYGLPRQTEQSFATTLDTVVELQPDRIAMFGYAHLPSKLPHQALVERAGRVLDSYERATLLLFAIERLTSAGYVHIGLDHFARPGSPLARAAEAHHLARTFQGYVEHRTETILGLGVSAISSTQRAFWQNHAELPAWEQAIHARRLPVHRGLALDHDDQIRRALIERLMCDGRIELDKLEVDFKIAAPLYFERELASLRDMADLVAYDPKTNTIETTTMG